MVQLALFFSGFFCWDVALCGGCFLRVFAFEGRLLGLFGSLVGAPGGHRVFFGCS